MDKPNFDDPSLWEVHDGVNVFDEHDEYICPTEACREKGKAKVADKLFRCTRCNRDAVLFRQFRKLQLEDIARNCNMRDEQGDYCPLMLGHTDDERPETEQPPIAGYGRQFHVAWDNAHQKWMVRSRYYLKKDRAREAKEYPRTSVEYWHKARIFDPISLVKRTPDRDLGQWTYGRAGMVTRYTMGDATVDATVDPTETPDPEALDPEMAEKFERYLKTKYPHLETMHSKYAATCMGPTNAAPPVAGPPEHHHPMPEPARATRTPENTVQKPAIVGTVSPAGNPEEERIRLTREAEQIRYTQMEARIKAMEARAAGAECEAAVKQLVYEGFELDPNAEKEALMPLDAAGRQARMEYVRKYYRQAPTGQFDLPVERSAKPGGPGNGVQDPHKPSELHERVMRYVRAHPGSDYQEVEAKFMAESGK